MVKEPNDEPRKTTFKEDKLSASTILQTTIN